MADRRKIKTKRAIVTVFLSLLKEKDINKITISEICDAAELGRGTFYLHYQDVYDLYSQIENELLEQFLKWIDELFWGTGEEEDFIKFMEKVAGYLMENRKMAEIFISDKGSIGFVRKIKDILISKQLEWRDTNEIAKYHDTYQLEYEISGIVGVLQCWIKTDMIESPNELAVRLLNMHSHTFLPCDCTLKAVRL